jgi:arginyl-tRNA synthetase
MKKTIIKLLAKETRLPEEKITDLLETPPSSSLGDFSFPCFILANPEKDEFWQNVPKDFFKKKNPIEIASHLKEKILSKKIPNEIEMIEQKGPYINFFVNKQKLTNKIIKINNDFGKANQKEKILLEHTSVNPNASPHVGRTRNSIIGDSIYRILSFLGNRVERHYYVNDVSKQVAMLALVFKPKDKFDDLLQKYIDINKKIEKNPKLEKQLFELLHKFEHKDKKTVSLFKKIVNTAVNGQKKLFKEIGIEFDKFDFESEYIDESRHVLKELEATGKTFRDEHNRLVLDQKLTSLITKMRNPVLVLSRGDGTGLYIARDLAYTIDKCKKGRNILILGEDQKLYFEQLAEALKLLNKPVPEVIHYSFVLLKGIGKMSTRRGEVVLLDKFLSHALKKAEQGIKKRKTKGDPKKVAIAAVKFAMLKNENNKNITFDIDESLNFEGFTGPYLQYSYARASSILKKASKSKKSKTTTKLKIPELSNYEFELIKKISHFPETVELAGKKLSPHVIAMYSYELAKLFNEFYHKCKVIGSEEEAFRLKLVNAFRITLKNALFCLGIETMDEM